MDHKCVKIFFYKRHSNSDLHELVPAVCFTGFYVCVVCIRRKTEETESSVGAQRIKEFLEDNGQAELILRNGLTVPVSRRYLKSLKKRNDNPHSAKFVNDFEKLHAEIHAEQYSRNTVTGNDKKTTQNNLEDKEKKPSKENDNFDPRGKTIDTDRYPDMTEKLAQELENINQQISLELENSNGGSENISAPEFIRRLRGTSKEKAETAVKKQLNQNQNLEILRNMRKRKIYN